MKKEHIFLAVLSPICLVNAIGFAYLWVASIQAPCKPKTMALQQTVKNCELCHNSADVISYVSQMGRLDAVSLSLTILGVVIAIAGLFGFWTVHREAMATAQDTAKDVAKKEALEYLKSPEGENLIRNYVLETVSNNRGWSHYANNIDLLEQDSLYDDIATDIWPEEIGGTNS